MLDEWWRREKSAQVIFIRLITSFILDPRRNSNFECAESLKWKQLYSCLKSTKRWGRFFFVRRNRPRSGTKVAPTIIEHIITMGFPLDYRALLCMMRLHKRYNARDVYMDIYKCIMQLHMYRFWHMMWNKRQLVHMIMYLNSSGAMNYGVITNVSVLLTPITFKIKIIVLCYECI